MQVALPGSSIKIFCRQLLVDAAPGAPVPSIVVGFPKAKWFTLKCQKVLSPDIADAVLSKMNSWKLV